MPFYGQNNIGSISPQQSPNNISGGWMGANYGNQLIPNNPWQQNYNRQDPNQEQLLPQINNVIRVIGPESAMNYRVGPNSTVMMMDSNRQVLYTKRTDDSGYPEIKAYELREIPFMEDKPVDIVPQTDVSNMATKDDIEEIKKQLNRRDVVSKKDFDMLKKMIEGLVTNNG